MVGAAIQTPDLLVTIDPKRARALGEIDSILNRVYCGSIATEHFHISAA